MNGILRLLLNDIVSGNVGASFSWKLSPGYVMGLWRLLPIAAVLTVHVWSDLHPLDITPLPHGLLKTEHDVRELRGVWTLLITFPDVPLLSNDIIRSILHVRTLLQEWKIPAIHNKQRDFWITYLMDLLHRVQSSDFGTRRRRALLPFIGRLGKSLFGLSTSEDYAALRSAVHRDREYAEAIHHDQEKLLSVINITRVQWLRDRHLLDAVVNRTRVLASHLTVLRTAMTDIGWLNAMAELHSHVFHLIQKVGALERRRMRYYQARHDLERGTLSELLLPIRDIRKLASAEGLPQGTRFVTPLLWYYRHAITEILTGTRDLTYVVRLPLVSGKHIRAVEVKSFPVPNLKSNTTLQLEVSKVVYDDPSTGLTQGLQMSSCMGRDPLVCHRAPEVRVDQTAHRCLRLLYVAQSAEHVCKVFVRPRSVFNDKFYMHGINDYVLVTWGTRIGDRCDRSGTRSLSPGVYRVQWSGNCTLCTTEVCLSGLITRSSDLKLERWEPFTVHPFSLPNSVVNLSMPGLATLPSIENPQSIDLKGLLTATEPPPDVPWEEADRSYFADALLGAVMGVFVLVTFLLYYCGCCQLGCSFATNQSTTGDVGAASPEDRPQARDNAVAVSAPAWVQTTPASNSMPSLISAHDDMPCRHEPSGGYRFETESLADGRVAIVPILSQTGP